MQESRDLLVAEMSVDAEEQRLPAAAQQSSWKRAAWAALLGTALVLGWLGAAPFIPAFGVSRTKSAEKEMVELNATLSNGTTNDVLPGNMVPPFCASKKFLGHRPGTAGPWYRLLC